MDRSTTTPQSPGEAAVSARPAARLPHRWWATPGYAMEYDGKYRPTGRSRGALIRAHALAGVLVVRQGGA
jgi:hypothetical protein